MKGRRSSPVLLPLLFGAALLVAPGAQASAAKDRRAAKTAAGKPDPKPEPQRTKSAAIREALPANVRIAVSVDGKPLRAASGVVLAVRGEGAKRTGYVITNAHVAALPEGDARIEVLVDGRKGIARHPAKVLAIGAVPDVDLAILEVAGLEAAPASLVADGDLDLGEDVIAIGAPYGKGLSVSSGIVSQLERDESGAVQGFKTDAPIGYGASGGGIFRVSDGKLLAVVEGYRTVKVSFPVDEKSYSFDVPMPGETFAAPTAKIRGFLEEKGLGWIAAGPTTLAADARHD